MKKILFATALVALVSTAAVAGDGGKDKKKAKASKECVKTGEKKKSCCASKATAAKESVKEQAK